MAAEVKTPDHNTRSSRYEIQWALAILFTALAPLIIFLLAFLLLGPLRNVKKFGTVEEGPSHMIT